MAYSWLKLYDSGVGYSTFDILYRGHIGPNYQGFAGCYSVETGRASIPARLAPDARLANWPRLIPTGSSSNDRCQAGCVFDASHIWVSSHEYNGIKFSSDGGVTWQNRATNIWGHVTDIVFLTGDVGFISTLSGKLYKTHNGGVTLIDMGAVINSGIRKIFALTSQVIAISSDSGYISVTLNGGANWTQRAVGGYVNSICVIDSVTILAAGQNGVFRSTDAGATWSTISLGKNLVEVRMFSATEGIVLANATSGHDTYLYVTNDGGLTWTLDSTIAGSHAYTGAAYGRDVWTFGVYGQIWYGTTGAAVEYILRSSATTGGTITPDGTISKTAGTNQAYAIAANAGYELTDVLVDGVSVGAVASYTFTNIQANHNIAAVFAAITYEITATAGANGSIAPSGAVEVAYNGSQAFTITAAEGYVVADVLVDDVSVGAVESYTFNNVLANHTIAASFALDTMTITASAGTGGTITPTGAVDVVYGEDQTFTITPGSYYEVLDVLVDGESVGAVESYTFNNVTEAHTIAASFIQMFYPSSRMYRTEERDRSHKTKKRVRTHVTGARETEYEV